LAASELDVVSGVADGVGQVHGGPGGGALVEGGGPEPTCKLFRLERAAEATRARLAGLRYRAIKR
jgi:hypothetical protein